MLIFFFIADKISISMYIIKLCVILCLFSALSRSVGALQIPIILLLLIGMAQAQNLGEHQILLVPKLAAMKNTLCLVCQIGMKKRVLKSV